ncbi:hypothetical protein GNI_006100 [Gregarina niphandrodes]|uniref:Uncharacterized protein n=1 Tax=Gregarina niphandrodes TaxID=110365 RepID=A0A023BD86_GRENI|nr:hypothetical protein GNI_006100 [Gregarina niphandrodes]EZG87870.1 hypothetical protein GNI_006100 [Gregarina niphandrodes]|eukprot:XP_011128632.1 hypothetical protein GNI_006100 [Gregarina niphandrodes]
MKTTKSRGVGLPFPVHVFLTGFVGPSCDSPSLSCGVPERGRGPVGIADKSFRDSTTVADGGLLRIQEVVDDIVRDYFDQRIEAQEKTPSSVDALQSAKIIGRLEGRILRPARLASRMAFGESETRRCTAWRWASAAGELCDRLDRRIMQGLLKKCTRFVSRPTGMTDQWYLAKILQRGVRPDSIETLMKRVGVKLDQSYKCGLLLHDMVMQRHFVRFPTTTEADRKVIFSVSRIAHWLLKTKNKEGRFYGIIGTSQEGKKQWLRTDNTSIKMAQYLRHMWGLKRFLKMAELVKELLPVEGATSLTNTCFFERFLGAVARSCAAEFRALCSLIGFATVDGRTLADQGLAGPEMHTTNPLSTNPLGVSAVKERRARHVADTHQMCRPEVAANPIGGAQPCSKTQRHSKTLLVAPARLSHSVLALGGLTTVSLDQQAGPSFRGVSNRTVSNVPSVSDIPSGATVGEPVDARVEEVQNFIADLIQGFRNKVGESSLGKKTEGYTRALESLLRILERTASKGKMLATRLSSKTGWRRAKLAGDLYEQVDHKRLMALFEMCTTIVPRPAGMSEQWYLSKIIQKLMPGASVGSFCEKYGIDHHVHPKFSKFMFNLDGIVMERHFCGLPETNGNSKLIIWSVCQVMSWLLKTRLREPYFKLIAEKDYWNGGISTETIELTAFLFRLWGPERFRNVAKFARTLLPVTAKEISDACFLGCFLRGVLGSCPKHYRVLCSTAGFSFTEKRTQKRFEEEGPEFFGHLPPNWETITTKDLKALDMESHPDVLSQHVTDFETASYAPHLDYRVELPPVAADLATVGPVVCTPAAPVTPFVALPGTRAMVGHSIVTLSEISHEAASRSAMHYAAALREWGSQEVEKALCASYADLGLRKRHGVEDTECPEEKRGKSS